MKEMNHDDAPVLRECLIHSTTSANGGVEGGEIQLKVDHDDELEWQQRQSQQGP